MTLSSIKPPLLKKKLAIKDLTFEQVYRIIKDDLQSKDAQSKRLTGMYKFFIDPQEPRNSSTVIFARNTSNVAVVVRGISLHFKGSHYKAAMRQYENIGPLIDLLERNDRIGMI